MSRTGDAAVPPTGVTYLGVDDARLLVAGSALGVAAQLGYDDPGTPLHVGRRHALDPSQTEAHTVCASHQLILSLVTEAGYGWVIDEELEGVGSLLEHLRGNT